MFFNLTKASRFRALSDQEKKIIQLSECCIYRYQSTSGHYHYLSSSNPSGVAINSSGVAQYQIKDEKMELVLNDFKKERFYFKFAQRIWK